MVKAQQGECVHRFLEVLFLYLETLEEIYEKIQLELVARAVCRRCTPTKDLAKCALKTRNDIPYIGHSSECWERWCNTLNV